MTRIVEKPSEPISKRANIGLYYVRNWRLLYEAIDHVLAGPTNKGEYYLTDAFQYMIDRGAKIKVVDVQGWYDAGELGTLLQTNRTMLEHGRARRPADLGPTARVVEPVYIEDGVTVTDSTGGAQRVALRRRGGRALGAARRDRRRQQPRHRLPPARLGRRRVGGARRARRLGERRRPLGGAGRG
jgi:NDP-sugar pyrophosphorylase family protein